MSALVLPLHLQSLESKSPFASPFLLPSRNHKLFFSSTTTPTPDPFSKELRFCDAKEENVVHELLSEAVIEEVKLKLAYDKVHTWLRENEDPVDLDALEEIFRCLEQVIRCSDQKLDHLSFLVTLIYADRYIERGAKIGREELFYLLLVSATTAIKFLEDEGDIDSEVTALISGITKDRFFYMERVYLQIMEYELNISTEDVEGILLDWKSSLSTPEEIEEADLALQTLRVSLLQDPEGSS